MRHPVANSSFAYERVGDWGKDIVVELHAARYTAVPSQLSFVAVR